MAATTLGKQRRHEGGLTVAMMLTGALLAAMLALLLVAGSGLWPAAMLLGGLVLAALVWHRPAASVYLLWFCAIAVEAQPLKFGLSITDELRAFQDLQALIGVPGLAFNGVELLAAYAAGVVVLKRVAAGEGLRAGALIGPFAVLLGVLALGIVRGVMAGGDATIALWGVRGAGIMFIAYLLSANLIESKAQVRALVLVLVGAAALKGLIGLWRYAVDIRFDLSRVAEAAGGNSLMEHEESFFFLMVVLLAALTLVYAVNSHDRRLALLSAALVALPLLANQRRAAIAALLLAAVVTVVVVYVTGPRWRRGIVRGLMVAALVLPAYVYLGWGHVSVLTMPVQAIKSGIAPDQRDASSNAYREIEDRNLRATAAENPLLGIGLGLPMRQVAPLPNIGAAYAWYLLLPHNGLLWLAMTTGVAGLATFSYLAASAGVKSLQALRGATDPELRLVYLLTLLALTGYLVFALLDQGLLSQRIGIFMGVLLGLLPTAKTGAPA